LTADLVANIAMTTTAIHCPVHCLWKNVRWLSSPVWRWRCKSNWRSVSVYADTCAVCDSVCDFCR